MNKNLNKYAQALYNSSKNNITDINNELNIIYKLYKQVPTFRFVIVTKSLALDQKCNIINNTLSKFDPLIKEFLSIIINDGYSKHLLEIIKYFDKLAISQSNIHNVDLIVSEDLDQQFINKLSDSLTEILKTKLKINVIHKPEIIGGIKLKIDNKVFDNSISYQLNKLKKSLYNI